MSEQQVNFVEENSKGQMSLEIDGDTKVSRQSTLDQHLVKESKAFHFVSTCNWTYPDFKGITHKIDTKKPYLMVKELGKNGGQEHHHLFFYSPKSLNTVKKYLTECNFLNLKHSDPSNPKYKKYDDLIDIKHLGCILYLLKGKTNHFICKDSFDITPEISSTNIPNISELRTIYEQTIIQMREKRDILIQDKVDNKEKKTQIELFKFFEFIEDCVSPDQLPELIGDFFLENPDIIHSDHKGFSFYKSALKKLYPRSYRNFCIDSVNKKIKQLTEL